MTTRKQLTLCMIHQHPQILLGMKKRGFGAGRWNGFGGKVATGESVEDAARRELAEEIGVIVETLEKVALIDFVFEKNPEEILEVHVFRTDTYSGEPSESEEMKPQWFHVDEIPFDAMWPDDRHWFPYLLSGKKFTARFLFGENDAVLEKQIEEVDSL